MGKFIKNVYEGIASTNQLSRRKKSNNTVIIAFEPLFCGRGQPASKHMHRPWTKQSLPCSLSAASASLIHQHRSLVLHALRLLYMTKACALYHIGSTLGASKKILSSVPIIPKYTHTECGARFFIATAAKFLEANIIMGDSRK